MAIAGLNIGKNSFVSGLGQTVLYGIRILSAKVAELMWLQKRVRMSSRHKLTSHRSDDVCEIPCPTNPNHFPTGCSAVILNGRCCKRASGYYAATPLRA